METSQQDATSQDIIAYALNYALKSKIITQLEHDKAKAYSNSAYEACRTLIARETGPTNCSPLGHAQKAFEQL